MISNIDKDKIRKVAALSASPHEGEAYKAMRLSIKLLGDRGGPATFAELIELALAIPVKSQPFAAPPPPPPPRRPGSTRRTRAEVSGERARVSILDDLYAIMSEIRSSSMPNAECAWVMTVILWHIHKSIGSLSYIDRNKLLKITTPKSWEFVNDMFERGSFYASNISTKQFSWLCNIFEAVLAVWLIDVEAKSVPWATDVAGDEYRWERRFDTAWKKVNIIGIFTTVSLENIMKTYRSLRGD